MLEVHHVVARIDKKASGLTYTIPRVCSALAKQNDLVVTLHVTHDTPEISNYNIQSYPHWPILDNIGIAPQMNAELKKIAASGRLIHNHSLWTMPSLYPGLLAKSYDYPLVFSPHGTLSKWALNHSRWKKRLFWFAGQKLTLSKATCFHASSESEYRAIRALGFKQPVALIPFGVDLPEILDRPLQRLQPKILLFFARLHPAKGIEILISVWSKLQHDFPDWELRIAGPEDYSGYQKEVEDLANKLECQRIKFTGPVYDCDKDKLLQNASLYILPTHTENFGITVAEALGAETPAIVTQGAPWEGLESHRCGWWIERNEKTIEQILRTAMSLPEDERVKMGKRGRNWIKEDFSWDRLGAQLGDTYEWLLNKCQKPEWVFEK